MKLTKTRFHETTRRPEWRGKKLSAFFMPVVLAATLLTVPSSVINAEPAQAEPKCEDYFDDASCPASSIDGCDSDNSDQIYRCVYTKGKWYAPYGGFDAGPRPSADGFKIRRDYGLVNIRFGPATFYQCKEGSGFASASCKYQRTRSVTIFYNKANTFEKITKRNLLVTGLIQGISIAFGGLGGITTTVLRESPLKVYITQVGMLGAVAAYAGAESLVDYFGGERRIQQARKGLCLYTKTNIRVKGVDVDDTVDKIRAKDFPMAALNKDGNKPDTLRAKTYAGWYAPEFNAACE